MEFDTIGLRTVELNQEISFLLLKAGDCVIIEGKEKAVVAGFDYNPSNPSASLKSGEGRIWITSKVDDHHGLRIGFIHERDPDNKDYIKLVYRPQLKTNDLSPDDIVEILKKFVNNEFQT